MPFFTLPDQSQLYFDDHGSGPAMLLLHGGLGRYVDWFHPQINSFSEHRLVIPDRRGYGRSTSVDRLPVDFHVRNANEMLTLLKGLSITNAILWGHSDGAVIATWMAINQPDCVRALILEGTHLWRRKPQSADLFRSGMSHPESFLPRRALHRMQEGHGERWRQVAENWAQVWLRLYEMEGDLYNGRLSEIDVPTLVLHGQQDPHTNITEIRSLASQVPGARLHLFPEAGHSPHSERDSRHECNRRVRDFLRGEGAPRAQKQGIP